MDIKIPKQQRKHRFITEAIESGESTTSVWPSPDELKNETKKKLFLQGLAKIGNDPRVIDIKRHLHDQYGVVFVFHLNNA